jgi:hypothetical protein
MLPTGSAPGVNLDADRDEHEVGARLRAHFARRCSVVLGCASLLLDSDLRLWETPQVGEWW